MNSELKFKIATAYQVCFDCGHKYGEHVTHWSTWWVAKCDVCGEDKACTEARDFNYLRQKKNQNAKNTQSQET